MKNHVKMGKEQTAVKRFDRERSGISPASFHLPPNRFYGARLKASYASDANWYRINKASAIYMMSWAGVLILLNGGAVMVAMMTQLTPEKWFVILIAMSPLLMVIAAVQTWLYARSAVTED